MTEKELDFLRRLEQLTKETGIAIGGCGCCGSPYLENVDKGGYQFFGNCLGIEWVADGDEPSETLVRDYKPFELKIERVSGARQRHLMRFLSNERSKGV
ncbi:MAG: hypothetical protein HKM94_08750 [Halobacteria archaeon]|nr:hypothetical protein [Halobacteria archaeon]